PQKPAQSQRQRRTVFCRAILCARKKNPFRIRGRHALAPKIFFTPLMRQNPKNTFIIALTGYGQESDVVQARQAGFDAHLLKPARMDDILKLISNLPRNLLH
ncbi:response regulator, partial [Herbaspirillum sp. GCM10030257]|uniref:response regulator n=1 Tax=Herbaspirillum sp. GCM10030257 TaxID=3273393 RepID=UPI003610E485